MSAQPRQFGKHREVPLYRSAPTHPNANTRSVYGVIYKVKTHSFRFVVGDLVSYTRAVKDLCAHIDGLINAINHIRNNEL